jgi:chromosome segregation ATPase
VLQPVRQFANNLSPNLSPRVANREGKRPSVVGNDPALIVKQPDWGDKENTANYAADSGNPKREKENNMKGDPIKDTREQMVMKLQDVTAEQNAKIAEQTVKLAQKEQAFEQVAAQHRETKAVHERLRLDLHEAEQRAKQKDATNQEMQKQMQQLQQEKNCILMSFRWCSGDARAAKNRRSATPA